MLPKNSKHYIQPVADQLDLKYDLAEDVISFYYNELRKKLTDLEFVNLNLY